MWYNNSLKGTQPKPTKMNEEKTAKSETLHKALATILNNKNVLRDKQRDALVAMADKDLIEISDGYLRLPTAFGKTVMFSLIARAFVDKSETKSKVVILVPRVALLWQTLDKLKQFGNVSASLYYTNDKDTSSDIIISTYHSARKLFNKLNEENQDIGLLIADEAHHALGEQTAKTIADIAENTPVIGFTATPTFSEEHALGDLLTHELYSLSISDCVKHGLLCPVKNILYRPSKFFDIVKATLTGGPDSDLDYDKINKSIKATLIDEISQLYVKSGDGNRRFRDMRAIVNCPNCEMAETQAAKINELAGSNIAICVHSKQKDFKKRVDAFLDRKYQVVCQVNTLTEGLDDPSVELCINYPSCSPVKIEQSGGRVLRIAEDKPNKFAYVLDTVFPSRPGESLEESLKNAFVAGQVLYRDIAGEFIVRPEDQNEEPRTSTKGWQKPKQLYEVITDETLLKRMNAFYKKWQRDESFWAPGFIPRVDELHDISAKYLSRKLFNPTTVTYVPQKEMLSKMKELKETTMPNAIHVRLTKNNRRMLFLIDEYYDEFVKNCGFMELTRKTKRDMDIDRVASCLEITKPAALDLAQKLGAKHKIDGDTGKVYLCLTQNQLAKYDARFADPNYEDWWEVKTKSLPNFIYLDSRQLAAKCISIKPWQIHHALDRIYRDVREVHSWYFGDNRYKDEYGCDIRLSPSTKLRNAIRPDGIINLVGLGKVPNLKLHKDFVEEFFTTAGFETKDKSKGKYVTSDMDKTIPSQERLKWKTMAQLARYLSERVEPDELHNVVEEFAKYHPNSIKLAGDRKTLLFNLGNLKSLCKFAHWTPSPIPMKTDKWRNATELKAEWNLDVNLDDITKMFQNFAANIEAWQNNEIVVLRNPETDDLELCINVRYIKKFLWLTGLEKKVKSKVQIMTQGIQRVETLSEINSAMDIPLDFDEYEI